MHKKGILLITLSLLLLCGLYFAGDFRGKKKIEQAHIQSHQHTEDENMGAGMVTDVEAINFEQYANEIESKLPIEKKTKLSELKNKSENKETPENLKNLAEFWETEKNLNMAAFYYKKAAFLENSEKSITFAGNLYLAILQRTEDPSIKKWQSLEAIACFEKALELNPQNNDTKIALAICYTDGIGETMKGITLLREVTQADSMNIQANTILGKMSIQSGQFDKAINRLELVLSQKPENAEAMYFLAEAYKGSGNKQKAIELFEKCKTLVKNPEFSKEIDNYIKTFN